MADNDIQRIKDKLISQHGKAKGMAIFRAVNKDASNQIAGGGGEIEGSELSKLMDSEDQITIYESKSNMTQGKAMGGSITKNRIGANDYRKGGYVLSTIDNRKVKRNGK